ncbi:MAG: GNAT family protein [Opitutaceae bacterium]|jgi:RimJ/RimL family protein N-acetyltransferase
MAEDSLRQPVGRSLVGWTKPPRPGRAALSGRFCQIEPLNAGLHADELFSANSADEAGRMWTYLPYGPFAARAEYDAWMQRTCCGEDPLFYAICDVNTGRPAGLAAYLRIDPANGVIEIGHLAYSPALQRTTAATEAMFLMIDHVFALGYRRCEWKCDSLNVPSRAAAERLGFTHEGVFRQAVVVKGRNRDTAWFSIIDTEWPARRAAIVRWLAPENFDGSGQQIARLAARSAT